MSHARWHYDCPQQTVGHTRLAPKPMKPEGATKSIGSARLPAPLYPKLRRYCTTAYSPSEKGQPVHVDP